MILPKIINPVYLIKKLYLIGREINNFIYYSKTVKKMENLNVLNAYGLRLDMFRNMYTAINLRPELLLYHDAKELIKFELEYIGNEFTKIENALIKFELLDLVIFKHKRIQNDKYYAYKLTGRFKFRELTIWWVAWYAFIIWCIYSFISWADFNWLISFILSFL